MDNQKLNTIIINIRVLDFDQYISQGYVRFGQMIEDVGPMSALDLSQEDYSNDLIIDGKQMLLTPGLINGHAHIYSTFARGLALPFNPTSFQDILDQLWWKVDAGLNLEDVYYSGIGAGTSSLQKGITTMIDHHASGTILGSLEQLKTSVVDNVGLRGVFCFETSDRFDVEACVEENVSFYNKYIKPDEAAIEMKEHKRQRVGAMLGMHASLTLDDSSMKKLGETSSKLPVHVHVAESLEDVEMTRKTYGTGIIQRFDRYGLLRQNSIYAHCIHLNEQEFNTIKASGGYVVVNPSSNMNNGVGLPQIEKMVKLGIPFFTGTDGLGYAVNRDLYNTYFLGHLTHTTHMNLLQMMESMDHLYELAGNLLSCKLGRIKKGYEADFVLQPYVSLTPLHNDNRLGHYFFGVLDQWNPKDVYIEGERRLHKGLFEESLMNKLQEVEKQCSNYWQRLQ